MLVRDTDVLWWVCPLCSSWVRVGLWVVVLCAGSLRILVSDFIDLMVCHTSRLTLGTFGHFFVWF